ILSGIVGMISIVAACWFVVFLLGRLGIRKKISFVERTLIALVRASEYSLNAEQATESSGMLQRIDPRVKILGLLLLIVAVAASHQLRVIGAIFIFAVGLALLSSIRLQKLAGWV